MTGAHTSSVLASAELAETQPVRQALVPVVLVATVIFNFVLCFVDTNLMHVSAGVVIATELTLIVAAFCLIWDKGRELYICLFFLAVYFSVIMVVRNEFDPKIVRDFLIPIVFFFLGRYMGSYETADRVVSMLIAAAVAIALWEWLDLDSYLRHFDVSRYYIDRGTLTDADSYDAPGLFVSGFRPNGNRTFAAFLGDHRVTGLFLEPVSVGNFGAIAFAWVLLRERSVAALAAQILGLATILVLGDARYGIYLCMFILILYTLGAPLLRPVLLFVLPAAALATLLVYGAAHWQDPADNSIYGRIVFSGDFLLTLNTWQVLGLQVTDRFFADAGYAYVLVKAGAGGVTLIWTLFIFVPAVDEYAWRFKAFIAIYVASVLCISTSLFTIKTAALLWFLYGAVQRPRLDYI